MTKLHYSSGESLRGQTLAKFILSVDDGCASDIRVAQLAHKYNVETIFYWPVEWRSLAYDNGYEPLTFEQAVEISKKHEIGSHTLTHRHLTKIPVAEACVEIAESRQQLEEMFYREVRKFCPPRGYTNDILTEFTLRFYESQRLTKGEGLVHIHPDSGANGNIPWREYADTIEVKELWGHSHEFDRYNLWDELGEYLELHA